MAVFVEEIQVALELIEENGDLSTLRRQVKVAGAQSWKPGVGTVDYPARMVWLNYELKRVDGERIKRGDQRVLIAGAGLSVTPDASTDSLVRADGSVWSVEGVETLSPNGEVVLHTLQVRG